MDTLRIFVCPLTELTAQSVLTYELLDRRRRVVRRAAAVPAGLPKAGRCELVLAAPDVLLVDVAVPKLSGPRLRKALPMLVEDLLLGDMEQSLVVAGPTDHSGRATVAVVDRELLLRALALFRPLGLRVVSATAEPLTLAPSAGRWRVRLEDTYGCARTGERLGIALSPPRDGQPPQELVLALAQAPERPSALEVEGEWDVTSWEEALGVAVHRVSSDSRFASPTALELLQYEAAPNAADWARWRTPMVLACAVLMLWIAGLNLDAWLLSREERSLRAQMVDQFKRTFPDVPVVLDPLEQMRRGVAELRAAAGIDSPADFLPLATRLVQALPDSQTVRSIEFREGELHVNFADARTLGSAAQRDALSSRLAQAGLLVQFSGEAAVVTPRKAGL